MKKRLVSFLLAVLMVLTTLATLPLMASAMRVPNPVSSPSLTFHATTGGHLEISEDYGLTWNTLTLDVPNNWSEGVGYYNSTDTMYLSDGDYTFDCRVKPVADEGYHFAGWSVVASTEKHIIVAGDEITATFESDASTGLAEIELAAEELTLNDLKSDPPLDSVTDVKGDGFTITCVMFFFFDGEDNLLFTYAGAWEDAGGEECVPDFTKAAYAVEHVNLTGAENFFAETVTLKVNDNLLTPYANGLIDIYNGVEGYAGCAARDEIDVGIKYVFTAPVHDKVQLWKDGPFFATTNIGAGSPEEYGDYFAWGETAPYYLSLNPLTWKDGLDGGYCWMTYSASGEFMEWSLLPYDTTTKLLNPVYDAATAAWGKDWRMLTSEEAEKLADEDYCTATWIDNYNGTGVAGTIITGATEGYTDKSIFLPASGMRNETDSSSVGASGFYWTAAREEDGADSAKYISLFDGSTGVDFTERYRGFAVRPVSDVGTDVTGQENPAFTAPTIKTGGTYNGKAFPTLNPGSITFTLEKPDDGSFMEYAIGTDAENVPETGWSSEVPTVVGAGTYYIWYRWQGKLYEGAIPACIGTIVIEKAAQTITCDETKTFVFGAAGDAKLGAKATGSLSYAILEGTSVKVSGSGVLTINSVGKTTIKITAAATGNYLSAEKTVTVEITAGVPVFSTEPAAVEGLVFNGKAQKLMTAGMAENGKIQYSLDGKEWIEELPTAINAGDYEVFIRIAGSENYGTTEPLTVTVTIAKAPVTILANDASSLVGAKLEKLSYYIASGKLFGNDADEITLAKAEGDQPGKYAITVTFANTNYDATLTPGTYSILQKDVVTENTYGVKVVSKGGQDPDSKLVVSIVEGENVLQNNYVMLGDVKNEIKKVYEIHFDTNGVTTQPDGRIQVRITIPEELRGEEELKVVYLSANGTSVSMDATREGDELVFVTDHLSQYAITVPTGGSLLWLVIVLVVVAVLAAGACVYFFIIRKKKKA